MIKRCETLPEVVNYIQNKHIFISQQKAGGYGMILLRQHDGRRLIIQEMRYFRIYRFEPVDVNTLFIHNMITGLSFKGAKIQSASSRLCLYDLVQINVYDHSSHFITRSGVDFAYIEEEQTAQMQALQEFIHNQPGVVRASWTDKNAQEDDLLDAMSFGHKRLFAAPYKRNIAIDGDI
jgi:hypothetical protein